MSCIFSIEGNIGSGKSTLVKILKEQLFTANGKKIIFLQEPVDEWESIKDESGESILEKFYSNQQKYAFSFQMMAYISRISLLKNTIKKNPSSIIITERSVYTDKEVFAKMLYNDGKIEKVNYDIYLKWFDEFTKDIHINGIIYVQAKPMISSQRVKKRNRVGEIIPLTYLIKCHKYYESWLENQPNIYVFDENKEFESINKATDEINIDNRLNHLIKHIVQETKFKSPFKPSDYDSILATFGC